MELCSGGTVFVLIERQMLIVVSGFRLQFSSCLASDKCDICSSILEWTLKCHVREERDHIRASSVSLEVCQCWFRSRTGAGQCDLDIFRHSDGRPFVKAGVRTVVIAMEA